MDIPCPSGRAAVMGADVDEVVSFVEDPVGNRSPVDGRTLLPGLGGDRWAPEVG